MIRTMFAWCMVVCLVAATAGCRLCADPYDYCRPTFTGECGDCLPNAREGSIFAPAMPMISEEIWLDADPGMEVPGRLVPVPDATTLGQAAPVPDATAHPPAQGVKQVAHTEPIRQPRQREAVATRPRLEWW